MAGNFHLIGFDQVINAKQRLAYDTASPPVTNYYGLAAPGTAETDAGWSIRRETLDSQGRTTAVDFAGGSSEYGQIWANRLTISYS